MKILAVLSLIFFACGVAPSRADDSYSHVAFTAVANNYWCRYGKPPKRLKDFAKVTDIKRKDPRITLDPEKWLMAVRIVGVSKYAIRVERVQAYGNIPETSTSSCKPAT